MFLEFDKIVNLIEFRVEENRVVGSIKTRNCVASRATRIRLMGYHANERDSAYMLARAAIALDILQEIVKKENDGNYPRTTDLLAGEDTDAVRPKASGKRGSRGPRKNHEPEPADAGGSGGAPD